MTPIKPHLTRPAISLATAAVLALGGCSVSGTGSTSTASGFQKATSSSGGGTGVWDEEVLHDISVDVDEKAVTAMIDTYQESGEKEWIEATATIDGTTFETVGLRLKGNSSLRGVDDDADPADLPWLVRLDEFVDGQELDGWTDFVVRSNNSETALNEAVALDLLTEAGLASEHAVATSFSVNGGEPRLRLVVQALDEAWAVEHFSTDGLLYKSEAGGDWSWRGTDPDSYSDVFDQETGEDDLEPLIDFLDFLNNSTDAEFESGLPERLDIDAFARYLAFEDLVANFDDIDGPGNNSYLRYDAESDGFTVLAWDHNLAFGGGPGGGPDGGLPDGDRGTGFGGEPPEGMPEPPTGERPEGMPEPPTGERPERGSGGPGGRSNVLVERFTAVKVWADLVEQAKLDLAESLYTSGRADEIVDRWAALLTSEAGHLVDADTVADEADAVREVITEGS